MGLIRNVAKVRVAQNVVNNMEDRSDQRAINRGQDPNTTGRRVVKTAAKVRVARRILD